MEIKGTKAVTFQSYLPETEIVRELRKDATVTMWWKCTNLNNQGPTPLSDRAVLLQHECIHVVFMCVCVCARQEHCTSDILTNDSVNVGHAITDSCLFGSAHTCTCTHTRTVQSLEGVIMLVFKAICSHKPTLKVDNSMIQKPKWLYYQHTVSHQHTSSYISSQVRTVLFVQLQVAFTEQEKHKRERRERKTALNMQEGKEDNCIYCNQDRVVLFSRNSKQSNRAIGL